jgi:uncharacterized protein
MSENSDESIKKRIEKDIQMFYESLGKLTSIKNEKKMLKIVELSKMYASDSKSYLDKGDLYTSFSCISYAHGLLDAIKELNG